MDIILETNNLSKKYKNKYALDNVNITVYRGDIYGFVGENGAGKSTFIRAVTNVVRPTSGSYKLNTSNRHGAIAAIIESPAFLPGLNALGNLRYQCDILGYKKSDEELLRLLERVGLESERKSKKTVKNFSLGMKQRLSIALILLSEPEFILLDEPMNGLDPSGIKEMRDLILKLNKEGTTFLISSHILTELDKVATRYGFISHGRLVEEISTKELRKHAKSYTEIKLTKQISTELHDLLADLSYETQKGDTLIFTNKEDAEKALKRLIASDFSVSAYEDKSQTIEDYYLQKINKENGKAQ